MQSKSRDRKRNHKSSPTVPHIRQLWRDCTMILAPFHECPVPNLGGLTLAGITFSRRGGAQLEMGQARNVWDLRGAGLNCRPLAPQTGIG